MCTKAELKTVLSTTYKGLREIFGEKLENVLLYGSYARGDYTDESDIDVMAIVDMTKEELQQYRREVSDFSSNIDLEYSVLLSIKLQDAETFNRFRYTLPFYENVMREGISVVQ